MEDVGLGYAPRSVGIIGLGPVFYASLRGPQMDDRVWENPAPEGGIELATVTASLKRCPDTNQDSLDLASSMWQGGPATSRHLARLGKLQRHRDVPARSACFLRGL